MNILASATAVLIGNGLLALLGMLALRIYTELAPVEIFGTASLVLGALAVAQQVYLQPIASTQVRFHTDSQTHGDADAFTAEAARWMLGTSLAAACLAAIALASWRWLSGSSDAASIALTSGLWLLAGSLRQVFMSRLHAEQRMRSYMTLRIAEQVTAIAATAGFLFLLAPAPTLFVVGQTTGFVLSMVLLCKVAPWRTLALLASGERWQDFAARLWTYGAPFAPMAVLYWLSSVADRYVLAVTLGADSVGKYLAAFTIAASGFGITNGVMTDLYRPKLFAAESAHDRRAAHRIFLAWLASYFLVAFAGLATIAFFGEWIIALLVAESYRQGAVDLMLWIAAGFTINGCNTAFENRLLSFGHSRRLMLPLLAGAIGNIVFSYWCITINGAVGAAQGNCASFVLQFTLTTVVLARAVRERREGAR